MSLAVLADHMASKGRGPDSMLIHMSPREVQGLQALAMKNGGSLTINPETGLPEAGFLDKLLPAIIGFALAPMTAGTSLAFLGATPFASALTVGGLETLRTGDIGKGISAGLGAYGGAGLQAGMATAGASALGSEAAKAGAGLTADMAANLADAGITDAGIQSLGNVEAANQALQQQAAERVAAASPFDRISAGASKVASDPMSFVNKDNFKYLAAAAAPVLADQAVTSKLPVTTTKPGMIRPYSYDPYGGTYTAGIPYEAQVKKSAGGGLMGMADGGMAGYDDDEEGMATGGMGGMFNFAQQSEPVVRMANGGIAHFVIGGEVKDEIDRAYAAGDYSRVNELAQENKITAADVASTYKGFDTSGLANLGINLYTPDTGGGGAPVDYFANQFAPDVFAPVVTGGGGAPVVTAPVTDTGGGLAALNTAATNTLTIPSFGASVAAIKADKAAGGDGTGNKTPKYTQYSDEDFRAHLAKYPNADLAKDLITYNADPAAFNRYIASLTSPFKGSTESDRGSGTFGIYNQFVAQGIDPNEYYKAALANDPKYAGYTKDMIQELYDLNKKMYALSDAKKGVVTDTDWAKLMVGKGTWNNPQYDANEMAQATGLSIAEVRARYELEKLKANPVTKIIDNTKFTGTGTGGGTNTIYGTGGSGTSGSLESVYGPSLPPGVSGAGITTVNPNGTITTRPNIPGIPEGGFTGMTDLRNAYTKGGGSLGYIPYTPKTIGEFNTKYTNTGGSKAALDYLMGKTAYSATPYTPTGEIQKPYFESVGRFPENRKAKKYVFVNGKYELNPDFVEPSYVLAGKKAAADKAAEEEKPKTEAPADIPAGANGGLMAMAGGGMSGQFNLGGYSDGGRLLRGPGDGVSDSIPATIGNKRPARLADGEFVVPARIVSELGNGSTEAGARKLYAMMDRVQAARRGSIGKGKVAKNSRADKYLPA